MRDGSALRLTTNKYFTPADRMIHGVGIAPDVEVAYVRPEKSDDDEEQLKSKKNVKEIFEKVEEKIFNKEDDEIEIPEDAQKLLENDNQVQRAVDLIRALNVYQTQTKRPERTPEPAQSKT
jgi:carboxyl-terminal processing protease